MKSKLLNILAAVILFLIPNIGFGQAPNLGTASNFALFTSAGAFNNTGTTIVTGNIGSFTSAPVGFPTGIIINGAIYGPSDPLSGTAAPDVINAYGDLTSAACGSTLVLPLAGQVLTPGVYCYGAAATLNGEITLNGLGNPDALFIIKIGGALATVGGSNVKLINSASPNNVYWQINGEFNLVDASFFRGNVISTGAINLLGTSTLIGRGLSTAGAISTASNTVTLGAPPAAPTVALTQPTCTVSTGTITITAPTGTDMTYSIDGVNYTNTTGVFSGLTSNTYQVTAKDKDGYVSQKTSVTINTQPVTPAAPVVGAITQPTCVLSTGSVVLSGLPTGTWTINPGGITGSTGTKTISGLVAGTYNFTVTNAAGCISLATSNVIINTQPVTPAAPAVGAITQPTCVLSTGSVILNGLPSGNWILNPGTISGTGVSYTKSGLATGIYNYTVTNADGCTSAASADIVINAQPVTPATPVVGAITQPICVLSTGSVALSGLPTGTWTINPGGVTGSTGSKTITGLAAGTYNFTVTNAVGCTSPATANVVINVAPSTISVSNQTASILSGQTFTETPTGVPAATTYTWTAPSYTGGVLGGVAQPVPQSNISGTLTIPAGSGTAVYTVTPIYGSCTGPTFIETVTVDATCTAVTIATQPVNTGMCVITGTATFTLTTAGTGPFTYQWQYFNGATWENAADNSPSGAVYTNQTTKTLGVSGITSSGSLQYRNNITNCSGANSITSNTAILTVNAEPTAPVVGTLTQPTCFVATGSVVLTGLPAGNWTINPGAIAGSTLTHTISGLLPGTYNYNVTNASGCISVLSFDVIINLQPATPTAPLQGLIIQPTCALSTGSVVLSGLPSGTWTINPGGITGSTGSKTISALAAGTYNFSVTNAAGCISPATSNVIINAQPVTPAAPLVGAITQPTCVLSTGSVVLSGLPTGIWTINPGGITGSTGSKTITGLVAGTYNYTVTNADGCISLESLDVVINSQPVTPAAPVVGAVTQPTCVLSTGSVILNGLPAGNWILNPGAIAGTGVSYTKSGLATGIYNYTVTNADGCTSAASADIVINAQPVTPPAPGVGTITQPTCLLATGSVILNNLPTGNWIINPGAITGNTLTKNITGLIAGTYSFTVTNAAGCTSPASAKVVINVAPSTIPVPNQIASILTGQTFTETPTGVPAATTYTWTAPSYTGGVLGGVAQPVPQSNISGTLTIPAGSGTAVYTVTPIYGSCTGPTFIETVTVDATCTAVTIAIQPVNTDMCAITGTATFTLNTAGTGPFTYQWQYFNGATWENAADNSPAGAVYTTQTTKTLGVSGITSSGSLQYRNNITNCSGANSITSNTAILTVNAEPTAPVIGTITQTTCFVATGSVELTGLPAGNWTINPGAIVGSTPTYTISGLLPASYNYNVTNASGCTSVLSFDVVINPQPATPTAPLQGLIIQPTCALSTGSVVLSGLPSGTWTINPGGITGSTGSKTISALAAGTYNFSVTNAAGCTSPLTAIVINAQPVTPAAPLVGAITQPTCVLSTGSVILNGLPAGNWILNPGAISGTGVSYTKSGLTTGIYNYTVTNADGCTSAESADVVINAQPVTPPAPLVGVITQPSCLLVTGSVILYNLPAGNWTINPGAITGNTLTKTITGLAAGTYNYIVTNALGCISAASASVVINAQPATPAAPTATLTQPTCTLATGTITITAPTEAGLTYSIDGLIYTNTSGLFAGLSAGTYSLTAKNSAGCVSSASAVTLTAPTLVQGCVSPGTVVTILAQPATPVAVPGSNSPVLPASPLNLTAVAVTGATYSWTGPNGFTSALQNPVIPSAVAANAGVYTLTVSTITCTSAPVNTSVVVTNNNADLSIVNTVDNTYPLVGRKVVFTVVATNNGPGDATGVIVTDILESGYTYDSSTATTGTYNPTTGTWTVGNMSNGANETITITATVNPAGSYSSTGTITGNEPDPDISNNTSTTITYPEDFFIPEGFSPNGDGINDLFIIRGISYFPENSIVIFNRWGNKVYEADPYVNTWDGRSIRGLRVGGDELPTGTYFYVLDLGDGTPVFKGTIYLNR